MTSVLPVGSPLKTAAYRGARAAWVNAAGRRDDMADDVLLAPVGAPKPRINATNPTRPTVESDLRELARRRALRWVMSGVALHADDGASPTDPGTESSVGARPAQAA